MPCIRIAFNRYWIPHKVPNYVAVFAGGIDHLFSIERIQWNETTDRIVLGRGVDIVEDNVILDPSAYARPERQGGRDATHVRSARLVGGDDGGAPIASASDRVLGDGEHNLELSGGAVRGEGNALANRLLGNNADNVLVGNGGDDVLYGGAGDDELVGGPGSDTYVYLAGDGNDVIVDEAGPGEIDQLVLAGGIAPDEVSPYRPAQSPNDLLLELPGGGSVLIKGFLASPSAGIERVVFDHTPAWERDELERLARAAPLLDDSPLVRRGPSARPKLEWSDTVRGLHPRAALMPTSDDVSPDIALNTVF